MRIWRAYLRYGTPLAYRPSADTAHMSGYARTACRWQAVRAYALFAWLFLAKYATLFHFYRAASANASTSHFSPHTVEIASIAGFFRLYGIIKACGVFNLA